MDIYAQTIPVTPSSGRGGRPRRDAAPTTPFAAWLAVQPRTVRQLAEELGVSQWTIYHLRDGYARPSLELANRLAELSRVPDPETGELGQPMLPPHIWPAPAPRSVPQPPRRRKLSNRSRTRRG